MNAHTDITASPFVELSDVRYSNIVSASIWLEGCEDHFDDAVFAVDAPYEVYETIQFSINIQAMKLANVWITRAGLVAMFNEEAVSRCEDQIAEDANENGAVSECHDWRAAA